MERLASRFNITSLLPWEEKVRGEALLRGLAVIILCAAVGVMAGITTAAVAPWAGFAVVLGVAIVLSVLRSVWFGVVVAIGVAYLLPFGVIPVSVGGVHLTFLDVSLSLLLLVWILRFLSRTDESLVATPLDGLVILFAGLAIASFVMGIYSVKAEVFRFFLKTINSILVYYSVVQCVRDRGSLEGAARALTLGAVITAGGALALYLINPETSAKILNSLGNLGYPTGPDVLRYIAGTKILRATGTSIDPNVLGGMLLLALPLILVQVFGKRTLLPRGLLIGGLLLVVAALILTYSRSSWFGAMAGVALIALLKYRKIWLVVGLGLALLILAPQGSFIVERFQSGVTFQDQAAQMRLGEYRDAVRLISLYPWFGVGFGEAPQIDLYIAASSIYLLMAEEMGLVGVGVFLAAMVVFYWHVLVKGMDLSRSEDLGTEVIQLGALGGVTGALSAGVFDHYFFNLQFPHTVALFWLLVGLAVVATRLRQSAI